MPDELKLSFLKRDQDTQGYISLKRILRIGQSFPTLKLIWSSLDFLMGTELAANHESRSPFLGSKPQACLLLSLSRFLGHLYYFHMVTSSLPRRSMGVGILVPQGPISHPIIHPTQPPTPPSPPSQPPSPPHTHPSSPQAHKQASACKPAPPPLAAIPQTSSHHLPSPPLHPAQDAEHWSWKPQTQKPHMCNSRLSDGLHSSCSPPSPHYFRVCSPAGAARSARSIPRSLRRARGQGRNGWWGRGLVSRERGGGRWGTGSGGLGGGVLGMRGRRGRLEGWWL